MSTAAAVKTEIPVRRRGNALGLWFFEVLLRAAGLKAAYIFVEFVCFYYLIFDRQAVQSALYYIEKRFPESGQLKYWHVHRLFVSQGRQLIDRCAIARKPEMFSFLEAKEKDTLRLLQGTETGAVLLTSHAGNWQVALKQMGHLKKEIVLVMRPEDNAAVGRFLQMGTEGKPVSFINPEGHLGGVLEMMQALHEGKLLCIMGDRAYSAETVEVEFLRRKAFFPYGAFLIAAAAKCPVIPFLTHKTSDREYEVSLARVWHPSYEKGKERKEQLAKWVQDYARLLEEYVKKNPYDCFLFHNVWHQDKGVLNDGK